MKNELSHVICRHNFNEAEALCIQKVAEREGVTAAEVSRYAQELCRRVVAEALNGWMRDTLRARAEQQITAMSNDEVGARYIAPAKSGEPDAPSNEDQGHE